MGEFDTYEKYIYKKLPHRGLGGWNGFYANKHFLLFGDAVFGEVFASNTHFRAYIF